MAEKNNIDFRQILTDVQSIPLLSLYVNFKYSDSTYDKSIKVEHQKRYRFVYVSNRVLTKIVGIVVAINRVYNGEIENNPPEYILTVDCSTEYGSNVKKVKSSQVRDIKLYVDHMDDNTDIDNAESSGGTTTGDLTNTTIKNVIVDEKGEGGGGTITGGDVDKGDVNGNTTGGITDGKDKDGNDITKKDDTVTDGKVDKGKVIQATIVITDGKTYSITTDDNGNKTFVGDLKDVIIVNSHITGGKSTGGTVTDPKPTDSIVYGGIVAGSTMITTGGITKGDITYGGTITGGVVTGGDAVGTWDGRQVHLSGDIITTNGVTTGATIKGGTVTGGQTIGDVTYNGTVVGGAGTAGITTGGTTEGGKVTYNDFDTSKYPLDTGDASSSALAEAIKIADSGITQRKTGTSEDSWERIPSGLIVNWDPNKGIRSNIADPDANIVPSIQVSKITATGVEITDNDSKSDNGTHEVDNTL